MNRVNLLLRPLKKKIKPILFQKEIQTLGRSESCDISINNKFLSFVHASLSISNDGVITVTDLGSTNGTFVNEEKISNTEIKNGDIVRFGSVRYKLDHFEKTSSDLSKQEKTNPNSFFHDENFIRHLNEANTSASSVANEGEEIVSRQVSLKEIYPQVEYSVFIVDDEVEDSPFIYDDKMSIEATTMLKEYVIDVNIIEHSDKTVYLSGKTDKLEAVYCPYLKEKESFKLFQVTKEQRLIYEVPNFETVIQDGANLISDPFQMHNEFEITARSLAIYRHKDFQLYLRLIEGPPKTKGIPFITFDATLKKLNAIFLGLWLLLSTLVVLAPKVEKEVKPETETIDRILFKRKPKPKIKEPELIKLKDQSTNPDDQVKPVDEKKKEDRKEPVKDSALNPKKENLKVKKIEKINKTPIVKNKEVKKKGITKKPKLTKVVKKTESQKVRPVKVKPEAKKEIPLKVNVKGFQNLLKNLDTSSSSNTATGNVGSKLGVDINSFEDSPRNTGKSGAVSLSAKKYDTGIKGEASGSLAKGIKLTGGKGKIKGVLDTRATVVTVGLLDPRDVQNVLKKYIPQFSFCYDKELERKNKKIATTLILNFTINRQGRAINRSFKSSNISLSNKVINCFSRVLKGIPFPIPKGTGVVGIRQPLNLEPRY